MRTLSTQAADWLPAFRSGIGLEGRRREQQAAIDLRSAGLMEQGSTALSDFGESVRDSWERFDVTEDFEGELAFALALLEQALRHRVPAYLDRLAFWWDIRTLYDVDALLADDEALLLLPYLNQTRGNFNPWAALLGSRQQVTAPIDWKAIKGGISKRGEDSDRAVDAIAAKVSDKRPLAPRIVFCRAMELVFVSRFEPTIVGSTLRELKLPIRGGR